MDISAAVSYHSLVILGLLWRKITPKKSKSLASRRFFSLCNRQMYAHKKIKRVQNTETNYLKMIQERYNGTTSMTTSTKLASVYVEPTTTPMDKKKKNDPVHRSQRPQRRLVDHTQYRRDGTSSSQSDTTTKITPTFGNLPRKTNLKMGLPTCFALEASLDDIILGDVTKKKEFDALTNNNSDRIHFYFKVGPKHQQKPTRTSSLASRVGDPWEYLFSLGM
jgi:hypothetical protein